MMVNLSISNNYKKSYNFFLQEDAGVLCAARGGWLLDLDETRGPAKNNFIKSLLANHVGTGDWGEPGYQ